MQDVKINRLKLLDIVRKNRQEHRALFLKALEGYREEAIRELEKMLEDAKKNKRISQYINLVQPMDQTKDYDRVIKMLELDVREEIELDERGFSQYVMDNWSWKDQFTASTSNYLKGM